MLFYAISAILWVIFGATIIFLIIFVEFKFFNTNKEDFTFEFPKDVSYIFWFSILWPLTLLIAILTFAPKLNLAKKFAIIDKIRKMFEERKITLLTYKDK